MTQKGICVGFFNMHDADEHIVRTTGDYHWNTLSATKAKALFERCCSTVRVIHIDTFLRSRFGCADTHNKGAWTFIITRQRRAREGPSTALRTPVLPRRNGIDGVLGDFAVAAGLVCW